MAKTLKKTARVFAWRRFMLGLAIGLPLALIAIVWWIYDEVKETGSGIIINQTAADFELSWDYAQNAWQNISLSFAREKLFGFVGATILLTILIYLIYKYKLRKMF